MNFVSNALGKAVTKWADGREYLVAPATTIVHGVLAGSKGALYYPPEETHKAGPAWNKVPVVLYHPMDEYGNNVEVDYPGARERQEIGFTRDTKTNNGAKLQHQVWFDVKKTAAADKRFGTDVLNRLKQGHAPIGTSTGLFTQDVPAAPGANHLGRPYHYVATNHRPDHLAVLPDQVGACSINDGCGILINGRQGKAPMTRLDVLGRPLTLTQNGWVTLAGGQHVLVGDGGSLEFGGGTSSPKEAADKAAKASREAKKGSIQGSSAVQSDRANKLSKSATDASGHQQAAQQHNLASLAHARGEAAARSRGAHDVADRHAAASQAHKEAAIAHERAGKGTHNQRQPMATLTQDQLLSRIDRLEEIILNAGGSIGHDEAGRFAAGGGKGTKLDPNDLDEQDDEEEDEDEPRDILGVPISAKGKSTKNSNPEGINQYSGGGGGGKSIAGGGGNSVRSSPLPPAAQVSQSAYAASEKAGTAHIAHRANEAAKAGDSKGAAAAHQEAADYHLALASHLSGKEQNDHLKAMGEHHNAMAAHQMTKNAEQGRHPKTGAYQGMAHTAAREGYADTRQNPLELDRFSSDNGDDAADPIEDEDSEIGQGDRPGVSKGADGPILNAETAQAYLTYNRDWPQAKRDALKQSAPEDFAGPGGSFPIKSQADVNSAAVLVGHASNPAAVKGKIKSIAERKGLALPASWKSQGTTNMSPEMYGGGMADPHQMSKQAAGATLQTEHEPAMAHAQGAVAASKGDKPERAAALHQKAAMAHESAATDARKVNQPMEASDHDNAAALHRKAASMQSATCNLAHNYGPRAPFSSPAEQKAAFAAMDGGGGESSGAKSASSKAEKSGKSSDHKAAAQSHRDAAEHHREEGNSEMAKAHSNAARYHSQKARSTTNFGGFMFNRAAALQQLTRNCSCDKDLVALNAMSDKMLQFMVTNDKAEGSNADTIGADGEDYAGSSEEVQDGANKIAKGGKVKDKSPAMNAARQWLESMPPEFVPVWNSAVEADKEKRMALVERITANVGDPAAKANMQKQFMDIQRYDIHQLRQLATLVPQPRAAYNQGALNPYTAPTPVYLGANGTASIAANQQQDMDDVLDIPTLNFAAEQEKQTA